MDRLTRQQLKQDEFRETFDRFEDYVKHHYQDILTVTSLVVVAVGLAVGLKFYVNRQDAQANAELGGALKTFRAYVGTAAPGTLGPDAETYPAAEAKYKKALEKFNAIIQKYRMYPRPKAVAIARYHAGMCQALVGDHAAAIKTLQEASHDRDREIAALARFALADELAKTGKLADAAKLYQELADHPTLSVPKTTALLAMADAYRATQPARSRQIYKDLEKEYGSDPAVAETLKEEMSTLPE